MVYRIVLGGIPLQNYSHLLDLNCINMAGFHLFKWPGLECYLVLYVHAVHIYAACLHSSQLINT